MSLESWKKEFLPKDVDRVLKYEAIAHALQKWTGLRTANLEKHGLAKARKSCAIEEIQEPFRSMAITDSNCALCWWHDCDGRNKSECPLAKQLLGPCDGTNRPYGRWVMQNNPEPMIEALAKILPPNED